MIGQSYSATQIRYYFDKFYSDDGIEWLDSSETLRQQGFIPPYKPVYLRRKFFFSDINIQRKDPVQLHLLYEQCRHSVIKGEYPITRSQG